REPGRRAVRECGAPWRQGGLGNYHLCRVGTGLGRGPSKRSVGDVVPAAGDDPTDGYGGTPGPDSDQQHYGPWMTPATPRPAAPAAQAPSCATPLRIKSVPNTTSATATNPIALPSSENTWFCELSNSYSAAAAGAVPAVTSTGDLVSVSGPPRSRGYSARAS